MVAIKVANCALAVVFLAVLSVELADSQKCKTKWNYDFVWTMNHVDYVMTYNISDTKTEQTCLHLLDNYHSPTDDNAAFVYKIGGVTYQMNVEFSVDSNDQNLMIFKDPPNERIDVYFDEPVRGMAVMYACPGTEQYILVGYEKTKPELAEVADDVAKKLTNGNPADFKITHDDC